MHTKEFTDACKSHIEDGRRILSISMGIVSHIENDTYEIVAVSSDAGVFVAGEDFPLKETYCREVYEKKETIALTEIDGHPGLQLHPLYKSLPLEAYISCPIFFDEAVWGTLNFSSMKMRDSEFSNEEIEFVESVAKQLSSILEKNK